MPVEWNYGYCEGNKEARVTFVNSGSTDVQTVISTHPPIKWETQIIAGGSTDPFGGKGQCCDRNYYVWCDRSIDGGNTWTANVVRIPIRGKIIGLARVNQPAPSTGIWYDVIYEDCNGVRRTYRGYSADSSHYLRINHIEILYGYPDNCGTTGESTCKFIVSDASGIVYTQTTASCPTNVTVSCGKQCPPNTCECRHGNRVCCYDSNGIPVLSFTA